MTHLADPRHPAWPLARLIVLMVALTAILYMTAAQFDKTELTAIVLAFLAAAGAEAGVRAVRGAMKEPETT